MPDAEFARRTTILVASPIPRLAELLAFHEVFTPKTLTAAGRDQVEIVVLSGNTVLTAADIASLPGLRLIVVFGAGYDAIDKAAADARGIAIRSGIGANADDVAEFAVMLLLAASRDLIPFDAEVRSGVWAPARILTSLSARKVGIVGLGHIGRATAARLKPFGCAIAWTGPRPKPEEDLPYVAGLLDLARQSDVLVLTAHLDETSRRMIDREVIDALGSDGLLVNVSRGGLVDEDALIEALRDGRLGGAALDVYEEEPTPAERWAGVPNLVLTPHTASRTHQAFAKLYAKAVQHVRDHLERPPA